MDIVAMGASSLEFINDSYHTERGDGHEVWTLNSGHLCFYYDKLWNMHDLEVLAGIEGEVNYVPQYAPLTKPIITPRALEAVPASIEFPLADCVRQFKCNYFANTVCYMIAGALMCGVQELTIYGADYNYPGKTLYEKGRPAVEFWIGMAIARGVKVHCARTSTLLDMVHRIPGQKGAMGYGEVYGYFNRQPEYDDTGMITGFKKPMMEIEDANTG